MSVFVFDPMQINGKCGERQWNGHSSTHVGTGAHCALAGNMCTPHLTNYREFLYCYMEHVVYVMQWKNAAVFQ